MQLDQGLAAVIGASVGAIIALISSFLTGWRQSHLEKEKWLRSREDTFRNETRSALADLAKALACYAHTIRWSIHKALNAGNFTNNHLENFEIELHKGIADMVSAQLHIAALDKALYDRVTPRISELIKLGSNTLAALSDALESDSQVEARLSSCRAEARSLTKIIPEEFGDILRLEFGEQATGTRS
jgi:hypothetical protein